MENNTTGDGVDAINMNYVERVPIDVANYYPRNYVDFKAYVTPKDLLKFAKSILLYLFMLVVFVFAMSYLMTLLSIQWKLTENPSLINVVTTILDITKTAVPSIVTLVLGFYFGKRDLLVEDGSDNDK